jgi:hypothetical protein
MKLRNTLTTVALSAAMAVLAQVQTAQAAFTDNLLDLQTSGGTLSIGDKIFSGFSFTESGLVGFNASTIIVTASEDAGGVYYLNFSGNMQVFGTATASADLKLNYTVTATAGSINSIDQLYTGGALGLGTLLINETAASGAPTAHSQLSASFFGPPDYSDPNIFPNGPLTAFDLGEGDLLSIIPAQATLQVTKDIAFGILAPGGLVTVSSVEQSFHQVPEPTTMIVGALLLLPFGASTLRILRKSRAA